MNTEMTRSTESKDQESKTPVRLIASDALPLSCPLPEDELWNMHPRVYLDIEKHGKVSCPYCGATYELE